MSDVFTLDDLDRTLAENYAPLIFQAGKEKFELRPLLRIGKTERDAISAQLKALEGDETDDQKIEEVFDFVLTTVVADGKGARLVEILGTDLLRKKVLFEKWVEKTQPGEASSSPE